MSHSITPIPIVAEYFGTKDTPIITLTFTPTKGWRSTGYNKRVSRAWLAKLKGEGVTYVTLTLNDRHADFSVEEPAQDRPAPSAGRQPHLKERP